ncbi:MAG: PLP-dependent aminotransferase family protein [Firmicutes bacterium]|nr:PLP-dependent aminotransferase family protein [Bacillota bacterium]
MRPIILNLNDREHKFIYEQLYEALREQILDGSIAPDEKLPSLRGLARDLGISVTAVDQAYDQLTVEGYIISRPKSGYFAKHVNRGTSVQATGEGHGQGNPGQDYDEDSYIHDPSCFDFVKWKKCVNEVLNYHSDRLLYESDPQGERELRQQVAEYIIRSRGVEASPERIVIGAGTQQITSHIARILRKMGINLVSIEEPGYLPVRSMLRDAGFQINRIPVKEDGIDVAMLPGNIQSAVYVSPSNQFPTGAVMPAGRRYELLRWAKENGSVIIEDDYDSELRYFGRPVPALKSLDEEGSVAYLGSFSSTLFPAVKISYMALPEKMAAIYHETKGEYSQTCSKSEQLTLALFMKKGYYYTGIRRLRALNSRKLEKTLDAMERFLGGKVRVQNTRSGMSVTLIVDPGETRSSAELAGIAAEIGLDMDPISAVTGQDTSALTYYYSQIPMELIDKKIEELGELWK